jgi:CRISPR system Cascade subunit CasB
MADAHRFSFSNNPEVQRVLFDWWKGLDDSRGERAELRRAATPIEVAFCPAFHLLLHAFRRFTSPAPSSLAIVAGILAHVKQHDPAGVFAAQMARPKAGSERARVSGLRFRRLLKISEREELYQPLIRTLQLLGGQTNIFSLADDIYFWGPDVRKNWAYAYYETAPSED